MKQTLVTSAGIHRIRVRATDMGSPRLSSNSYVEIRVGTSDNNPSFKFAMPSYTMALDEDVDNGKEVRS